MYAAWGDGLPERLREHQPGFGRTGGLHAAGLFEADGSAISFLQPDGVFTAKRKP